MVVHNANHEYILTSMTRVNEVRNKCELSCDADPSSFETTKRSTSSHRTECTDQSSSDGSFDKPRNEASRSEMLKILTEADPEMTQSQRLSITTPVKKKKVLAATSAPTTLMNPMDDDGNLSNDSFGFGHEEDDWWNSQEMMSTTPPFSQGEFHDIKPKVSEEKTNVPAKSYNSELSKSRHKAHKEYSNEKRLDPHKDKKKHRTSIKVRASDLERTNISSSSIDPKVIEAMKASGGGRRRISAKELEEMGVKVPAPRGRPTGISASEHQPKQIKSRTHSKSRGRPFARSRSRGRVQGRELARENTNVRSKSLGRPTGHGEKQQQRSKSHGRVRETPDAKSRSHSVGRSRARSRVRSTASKRSYAEDHSCLDSNIPMTISIEIKPTDNQKPASPSMGEKLLREDSIIKQATDQRERRLPKMKNLLTTENEDSEGNEDQKLVDPTSSPDKLLHKKNLDNAPTVPTRYTSPLQRLKRVFSGRFSPRRSPKKSLDVPGTPKTEPSLPFSPKAGSIYHANEKEGDMYSMIKSAGITESQMRALAEKGLTIAEG